MDITVGDIIASSVKYDEDNVLELSIEKARDLKTINPKSPYDTTYIPLLFKHVNGKKLPVKIKISEQIIASSAKKPHGTEGNMIPKHLNLSFMHLPKDEIAGGDYIPKKKDTEEEQLLENKKNDDKIERYYNNNNTFNKAMGIIDKSFKKLCSVLKKNSKDNHKQYKFKIQKDRKMKDIPVFSFKQEVRFNKDTDSDEVLENPIYRIKIPVCNKDGRLGIWSNYYNSFKHTVFDTRKMTKKNKYQPVPAKVKVNNKLVDIDVNNAKSFITYKSLIGGHITFECIVASKFGLSINNSFYDLYVHRYKTKSVQASMTNNEIIQMRGGDDDENSSI